MRAKSSTLLIRRVSRAVSAVMMPRYERCFPGSFTRPSASNSENMRIDVSGVFNSCDTLLTKSVFCRASRSCRFKSATISQLPTPMATSSTLMSRPSVNCSVCAD